MNDEHEIVFIVALPVRVVAMARWRDDEATITAVLRTEVGTAASDIYEAGDAALDAIDDALRKVAGPPPELEDE